MDGGPPCFPPDSSCPAVLWFQLAARSLRLRGCYPLWPGFPAVFYCKLTCSMLTRNPFRHARRFGLFPVRSPLLGESFFIFSSCGYWDVSVPRVPSVQLCIHRTVTASSAAGFPHSDIHGSMPVCDSPWLFAAYRVLLRRMVPGHPPCALCSLITFRRF